MNAGSATRSKPEAQVKMQADPGVCRRLQEVEVG